jgi:DNA-directed RNA polymerase specialized sigma24 family protein
MPDTVDRLRNIQDPVARWKAATAVQEQAKLELFGVAPVRTEIVVQLQHEGLSVRQIADLLGISKTRVVQIGTQRTA